MRLAFWRHKHHAQPMSEGLHLAMGIHQALRNRLAAEKKHLRQVIRDSKPPKRFFLD